MLPREQCEGIKKYIVALIIKTSSEPEIADREKVYLGKLNMILVEVLLLLLVHKSCYKIKHTMRLCIDPQVRVAQELAHLYF